MSRSFLIAAIAICLIGSLVQGCDSSGTEPTMAAGLHSDDESRVVTVYLQADSESGFSPTYAERIVTAKPTSLVPVTQALGKSVYENTDIEIIGESCEKLRAEIPDLLSCSEIETTQREYGNVEITAPTNLEGLAVLHLTQQGNYQVSVQSWPTQEDEKCHWGGSEILEQGNSTVSIRVAVACE